MKPFAKLAEASQILGLSQSYLRGACKRNEIPHILSGRKVYVNLPATLRLLGVTVDISEGEIEEAN